jgi:hypothetical protein
MVSFLWLLAGAAWAARVDDPGLVDTVHELHEQYGAIAVLTPNNHDERMAQTVLGVDPRVAYLQAGSPSESAAVLQRADIVCGLHVARRPGGWDATRVGVCVPGILAVLPPPPPPVPLSSPAEVAATRAEAHDRDRTFARAFNGVAIVGTSMLVGGLAWGAVPCESHGDDACFTGAAELAAMGIYTAVISIPITQIEIARFQGTRKTLGVERPPGPGASVAMFVGGIVVAFVAGATVHEDPEGIYAAGTALALGWTGAIVANSITIHRARPLSQR